MAATPSTMVPLGTIAPAFTLPDTHGRQIDFLSTGVTRGASAAASTNAKTGASIDAIKGASTETSTDAKGHLICFICNHCPFVKHIEKELLTLAEEAMQREIAVYAISSNDAEKYPEDAPDKMAQKQYPFPYVYDETQEVARAYDAACTPDFFLFDAQYRLVYRGQFDDSRPGNSIPPDGRDLRTAIDALITGRAPLEDQRPSIGCNIKWK